MNYDAIDPTFVRDLANSQASVWRVARWLNQRGHNVTIRPTSVRPSAEQMHEYADCGDLEIVQRIEVKQRPNLHFTSAADFPYATVIVDVCHAYDRARPKPFAYIILNAEMTVAIVIPGTTTKHWQRVTKPDRYRHRERSFYECPVEFVQFHTLATE